MIIKQANQKNKKNSNQKRAKQNPEQNTNNRQKRRNAIYFFINFKPRTFWMEKKILLE